MMFLTDFDAAARAIGDVVAFGVVLADTPGRVRLMSRFPGGMAAHRLPVDSLPAAFTATVETLTTLAPLAAHPEASHPIFSRMCEYAVECLIEVPMPGSVGIFWAGKQGAPYTDGQIAAVSALAERIAAALQAPEEAAARDDRLSRIEAVEQLLPIVSGTLDVRDIFHRISEVARSVLPHDAATIRLIADDHVHVRLYALDGIRREDVPETFSTNYAPLFNENFLFSIYDDLLASVAERDRPTTMAGFRSALRAPIRINGDNVGAVEFDAIANSAFNESDIAVAIRISDYVTLAIAHQRMADEARRAAALRERTGHLMLLDDLLATLGGVLDVRDVFDRVSAAARKVIAHDAMGITSILAREKRIRVHAVSGFGDDFPTSFESPMPEPELLDEPWDHRIIDDMPADPRYAASPTVKAGMRSVLGLPVRIGGQLAGGVNFYSRRTRAFSTDDVLVARRIADYLTLAISHQRLAEEAQTTSALKARSENLELLDELLAAITDSRQLSEMFDRVSEIAKNVIPHDAMALPVLMPDGVHARRYASAGLDVSSLPEIIPVPPGFLREQGWEYDLIDDAETRPEPYNQQVAKMGFRSALRVPILIDRRFVAGIAFMAHEPGVYTQNDVVTARRIAERFALCLAREQSASASRRADEATARASRLESRVRELTDELDARTGRRVVGDSPAWKHGLTQATQVAATETTVLLLGESGTGKEVVARFIHRASSRKDGPFIALNCAALPEQLLEAELFGYERGAFTGATQSKPGQLEQAGGGTLFLDEVGEMSLAVQAKFLRVLQEREFQRLGGTRVLRTGARVIAATNRDLQQAMSRGQFREDLFYRLNVFAIRLPPLRDRREDVLPLAETFLAEFGRTLGRPPSGISRDARTRLVEYDWPGNVRELGNILERAAILCDGGLITAEHLALTTRPAAGAAPRRPAVPEAPPAPATPTGLADMERTMVEEALKTARFNKSKAAAALGLTRAQLYVRMRRYGLE